MVTQESLKVLKYAIKVCGYSIDNEKLVELYVVPKMMKLITNINNINCHRVGRSEDVVPNDYLFDTEFETMRIIETLNNGSGVLDMLCRWNDEVHHLNYIVEHDEFEIVNYGG